MHNWAGQEIKVGSIVWRGARAGNTSDFKIGVVSDVSPHGDKVRVQWKFTEGFWWRVKKHMPEHLWRPLPNVTRIKSSGSPSIDSLAVIDIDLDELDAFSDAWEALDKQAVKFLGV